MKIIIDECLPKRLTKIFSNHDTWTVPQIGLAGYKDSELLKALDEKEIDKHLKGKHKGKYRKRAGHYRIIYLKENNLLVISVIRITHRKEVY